jgi:hypothetical protein
MALLPKATSMSFSPGSLPAAAGAPGSDRVALELLSPPDLGAALNCTKLSGFIWTHIDWYWWLCIWIILICMDLHRFIGIYIDLYWFIWMCMDLHWIVYVSCCYYMFYVVVSTFILSCLSLWVNISPLSPGPPHAPGPWAPASSPMGPAHGPGSWARPTGPIGPGPLGPAVWLPYLLLIALIGCYSSRIVLTWQLVDR